MILTTNFRSWVNPPPLSKTQVLQGLKEGTVTLVSIWTFECDIFLLRNPVNMLNRFKHIKRASSILNLIHFLQYISHIILNFLDEVKYILLKQIMKIA